MQQVLDNVKKIVPVEDDSLARALIAVQRSPAGVQARINQATDWLQGKKVVELPALSVGEIRAAAIKEVGHDIQPDDPFMAVLIASQQIDLTGLISAIEGERQRLKEQAEKMRMQQQYNAGVAAPEPETNFVPFYVGLAIIVGLAAGAGLMWLAIKRGML